MPAKILHCNCINDFQDKTYGNGMRVHTEGGKESTRITVKDYTCTVCGNKIRR
jgi:ribosomal protein L44E